MRKVIPSRSRYGKTYKLERIGESDSHLFLLVMRELSLNLNNYDISCNITATTV